MVVVNTKMSTSIMQKNYSHCPLKKRPVQYILEEEDLVPPAKKRKEVDEPENLSTKPEDLSKTGRYPKVLSPIPENSEHYAKNYPSPPAEDYRQESPPAAFYPSLTMAPRMKSAFEQVHSSNSAENFWNHPSLHRPLPGYNVPPFIYAYDYVVPYGTPVVQFSPTRSTETGSPYARESSCSPPSVEYIAKMRAPVNIPSSRFNGYSDYASLSPTSSDNSFQSNSPPLEETTPEDLSSPLSESSETIIIPDKKRKENAQRYNCNPCGKSYSTYSGLTKHQQYHCPAVDGNQVKKSFNCNFCKKIYTSLGALKMHIRTHTLPCKCHMCGKAFSRPWLLQGHIRTHTGEKPFSCQHCNRAFADRSNLRAHLQTHSDVKKYSCPTCSKTFSRMSLLTKHNDGGCPGNGPQIQSYPTSSEIMVY